MKPGEAQVGQRVRTLVALDANPTIKVGTWATIAEVVTQEPGAQDDSIVIHPHGWADHLCFPCLASHVELVV